MKEAVHKSRLGRHVVAVFGACLGALVAFQSTLAETANATAATNEAKNLARLNCGTRINWVSQNGLTLIDTLNGARTASAEGLILDDNTLNCRLFQGDSAFVINLQRISFLDRFSFINEKAEAAGTVDISVSNYRLPLNDPKWQRTDAKLNFSGKRFAECSLRGVEGKYVRISFHIEKPGTIAGVGLYGQKTLRSFAEQQKQVRDNEYTVVNSTPAVQLHDGLNFNFANLYANAHVVYVSSGSMSAVQRMIDDDPATGFAFGSSDTHPTVVIELAESRRLRRISAVYEMEAGRLDIFLFNQLPENPANLENAKPVVSITDQAGGGKAASDFDPHGARYVALRWTPNESGRAHKPFMISEIGAFSNVTLSFLELTVAPDRLAENSGVPNVPFEPPPVLPMSP